MGLRRTVQFSVALFAVVAIVFLAAAPAAATAETDPASFEYHAVDLIDDGSQQINGETATLVLDGTASEGDSIEIAIDENERNAFDITDATGHSDDIDISVGWTAETISVTLTDLGGDGNVSGVAITVTVDLRASDAIVGGSKTRNETTVGSVVGDPTGGLVGDGAITVSVAEAAEIGFTAEEIDDRAKASMLPAPAYGDFVLSFVEDNVTVSNGDSINVSVNPEAIKEGDEGHFLIEEVYKDPTKNDKLDSVNISTSNQANVLENSVDQITLTLNTTRGETTSISGTAILASIRIGINEKSMRSAANRYHETDFFEVDVEGENNTELTDNADVRTESPLFVDIYPNEVETFALGNIEPGAEVGVTDGQVVGIETIEDEFGNEIREPTIETTLVGAEDSYTDSGISIDTADREGIELGQGGEIEPSVGVFDLTVEITDIEGPKTHTSGAVTATVADVVVYPDDVALEVVGPANDFDADGGEVELAVDLGVSGEAIDRLDLEFRRTAGNGTVTFNASDGDPTPTTLWTDTAYAGDGALGSENVWAIERDLTAADFDSDGARTYALETDTADRYGIAVDVMPYEGRLVADETEVNSSTVDEHDNSTRETAEVVATGPIEAITNVTVRTDHEFVGTESDPGDIVIDLETFVDANGNTVSETAETVSVGMGNETIESGVGSGSVTVDVGPTAETPSATVEFDPTEINTTTVETGANATIAIAFEDGRQRNTTDITLLHRAIEPGGATWQTGSLPQPATLYVDADGARDIARWNATAERYESFADAANEDVLDHQQIGAEHLHSGFYFRSADDGARLGYEFVTDDEATTADAEPSESVELEAGWHLASSNYDISTHTERDLAADVNWTSYGFGKDDDAFVVRNATAARLHDRTSGSDIDGATEAIGHDETYWIRVIDDEETPLDRTVVAPTFAEADGIQESGGS